MPDISVQPLRPPGEAVASAESLSGACSIPARARACDSHCGSLSGAYHLRLPLPRVALTRSAQARAVQLAASPVRAAPPPKVRSSSLLPPRCPSMHPQRCGGCPRALFGWVEAARARECHPPRSAPSSSPAPPSPTLLRCCPAHIGRRDGRAGTVWATGVGHRRALTKPSRRPSRRPSSGL
jgi:hypothetical protein